MKRDGSHFGAGGRSEDAIQDVAAASVRIEELRGPIEKSPRGERNSRGGPADTHGQEIEVMFAANENGSGLADVAVGVSLFVRSRSALRGAEQKIRGAKQLASRSGRYGRSKTKVMGISKEILDAMQLASRCGRYNRSKSEVMSISKNISEASATRVAVCPIRQSKSEVMCAATKSRSGLEAVETSVSSFARRGSIRCAGEEKSLGAEQLTKGSAR